MTRPPSRNRSESAAISRIPTTSPQNYSEAVSLGNQSLPRCEGDDIVSPLNLAVDSTGFLRGQVRPEALVDNAISRTRKNFKTLDTFWKNAQNLNSSPDVQAFRERVSRWISRSVSGFDLNEDGTFNALLDGLPLLGAEAKVYSLAARDRRRSQLLISCDPHLAPFLSGAIRRVPLVGEIHPAGKSLPPAALGLEPHDFGATASDATNNGLLGFVREAGSLFLPGKCVAFLSSSNNTPHYVRKTEEITRKGSALQLVSSGEPVFPLLGIGIEFVGIGIPTYSGHFLPRVQVPVSVKRDEEIILSGENLSTPFDHKLIARTEYLGLGGVFRDLPSSVDQTQGGRPRNLRLAAERDLILLACGASMAELTLDVFELLPREKDVATSTKGAELPLRAPFEVALRLIRSDSPTLDEFIPEVVNGQERGAQDNPSMLLRRFLKPRSEAEFSERLSVYLTNLAKNMAVNVSVMLSERVGIPTGGRAASFFDRQGLLRNSGSMVDLADRYQSAATIDACVAALCDVALVGGINRGEFLRSSPFRTFVTSLISGDLSEEAYRDTLSQLAGHEFRLITPSGPVAGVVLGSWWAEQSLRDEGLQISAKDLLYRAMVDPLLGSLVSDKLPPAHIRALLAGGPNQMVPVIRNDGQRVLMTKQETAERVVLRPYLHLALKDALDSQRSGNHVREFIPLTERRRR